MIWPFTADARRRWRLHRTPRGALHDFLSVPFPLPSSDYRSVDYLAIDLETTGLDAQKDHILSIGYVTLHGNRIDLGNARHRLIRTAQAIPEESAIIHQITDDQAAAGEPLEAVMADLLQELAGKVMIAHHASVEQGFLSSACRTVFGAGLLVPIVDTQIIALRTVQRRQVAYKGSDLRLHALGDGYNLPRYDAHNALSDALSAAELFLAQAAHKDSGKGVPLRDLLW